MEPLVNQALFYTRSSDTLINQLCMATASFQELNRDRTQLSHNT